MVISPGRLSLQESHPEHSARVSSILHGPHEIVPDGKTSLEWYIMKVGQCSLGSLTIRSKVSRFRPMPRRERILVAVSGRKTCGEKRTKPTLASLQVFIPLGLGTSHKELIGARSKPIEPVCEG